MLHAAFNARFYFLRLVGMETSAFSATQLDRHFLRGITERRYYERGVAYFEGKRVTVQRLEPLSISATVSGSEHDRVQLAWRDGALHCTSATD